MRRPLATGLLLAILTSTSPAFSEHSPKIETITAQIVAYSSGLVCLNGNGYWSMLIHVQDHATEVPSQFVEVRFSLPCNKSPEWIARKSTLQTFRLTRDQHSDAVLKEFMGCGAESPSDPTSEPCPQAAMWKRVPGAELEELPFGQQVPSYRSVDLPLGPVV